MLNQEIGRSHITFGDILIVLIVFYVNGTIFQMAWHDAHRDFSKEIISTPNVNVTEYTRIRSEMAQDALEKNIFALPLILVLTIIYLFMRSRQASALWLIPYVFLSIMVPVIMITL